MIQVLRFKGVASITVTDLHATRLEVARQLGAIALPVNFMKTADVDHAFDLAIDATESPDAIRNLPRPARDGGKILLFGVCPPGVTVPYVPNEIYCRELTIVGSFSLNGEIEEAPNSSPPGQSKRPRLSPIEFYFRTFRCFFDA
jgi:D-altritol 5-dehydrogenase